MTLADDGGMKTLREINAGFNTPAGRAGLCNAPHPDPKFHSEITVMKVVPGSKVTALPQGVVYPAQETISRVICSQHAGHDDGVCKGWGFSIIKPLEWPTARRGVVHPLPSKLGAVVA